MTQGVYKKYARVQIKKKQEFKQKEICRNIFLLSSLKKYIKKDQNFKSETTIISSRKKFVETSFSGVMTQGVYKKRRRIQIKIKKLKKTQGVY